MDTKITFYFENSINKKDGQYVVVNKIGPLQLTEFLVKEIDSLECASLKDCPISMWINQLAEGHIIYQAQKRSRKASKAEYYSYRE